MHSDQDKHGPILDFSKKLNNYNELDNYFKNYKISIRAFFQKSPKSADNAIGKTGGWSRSTRDFMICPSINTNNEKDSILGLWPRILILHQMLEKEKGWNKTTFTDYLFCKYMLSGEFFTSINNSETGNRSTWSLINRLLSNRHGYITIKWVHDNRNFIENSLPTVGQNAFKGQPSLDIAREKIISGQFSTPSEFIKYLIDFSPDGLIASDQQRSAQRSRVHASFGLNELINIPPAAIPDLEQYQRAQQALSSFLKYDSKTQIFTIAGAPNVGKSGLMREVLEDCLESTDSVHQLAICYIDTSRALSFDMILDRIGDFLLTHSAISPRDVLGSTSLALNESEGGRNPLRIIQNALRSFPAPIWFFMSNLRGAAPLLKEGGGIVLQDDRLEALINLLSASNSAIKFVLTVLDETWTSSSNFRQVAQRIDIALTAPGTAALPVFIRRYGEVVEDSVVNIDSVAARLGGPIRIAEMDRGEISSRIFMAAVAYERFVRLFSDDIWNSSDEALIESASLKDSPTEILEAIYTRFVRDDRERVVLSLIAFSDNPINIATLAKLLRYHRQFFDGIKDHPSDSATQSRDELWVHDVKFIMVLQARWNGLVSIVGLSNDNSTPNNDDPNNTFLSVVHGLRGALREVLVHLERSIVHEINFILAREQRRDAMRYRLRQTGGFGSSYQEIRSNLAAAIHLISYMNTRDNSDSNDLRDVPYIVGGTETAIFTRYSANSKIIVQFIMYEMIRHDVDVTNDSYSGSFRVPDELIMDIFHKILALGTLTANTRREFLSLCVSRNSAIFSILPSHDIGYVLSRLTSAAIRMADFPIIWKAQEFLYIVDSTEAYQPSGLRAYLNIIDAMFVTKGNRQDVNGQPSAVRKLTNELITDYGGIPSGIDENTCIMSPPEVKKCVDKYMLRKIFTEKIVWFRIKLCVRLAYLKFEEGAEQAAYLLLFEAIELDNRHVASGKNSELSGITARIMIYILIHYAQTQKDTNLDEFNWARLHIEALHRINIRRISEYPNEQLQVFIDESIIEGQCRGSFGNGDMKNAYSILASEKCEIALFRAPILTRIEYWLERSRNAIVCAYFDSDQNRLKFLEEGHKCVAESVRIRNSHFGIRKSGLSPIKQELEIELVKKCLEIMSSGSSSLDSVFKDPMMSRLGFRSEGIWVKRLRNQPVKPWGWMKDVLLP